MDSEYTLDVDVIDVMASAKSKALFAAAGTPAFSAGGANLYGCHVRPGLDYRRNALWCTGVLNEKT